MLRHTDFPNPPDGLPRVRLSTFFLNPALCASSSVAGIGSIFLASGFVSFLFLSSISWGILFSSILCGLATSFEQPRSKSCFCRMYIFFVTLHFSDRKITEKTDLLKKSSSVFGSFTSSHRTKILCGDMAEVGNKLPAPLPLSGVLPQLRVRGNGHQVLLQTVEKILQRSIRCYCRW